jgi:hypothetical protein
MSADQPANPFAASLPAGTTAVLHSIGRGGEVLAAQTHGKWYTGSYYSRVFNFNVTALTVPVVTSGLVSVFSVYNTNGNTVAAELIDFDLGLVLLTTVVDTVGLYWQGPTLANLATLSTKAVFGTNWFGGSTGAVSPGQVQPYLALTHSGTPVRIDILSQFGAVTTTNDIPVHKEFDGKILLMPGCVISVAMSTASSGAANTDLSIRWQETNL